MTDARSVLARIQAVTDAATPGKWEVSAFDSGHSKYELNVSVITAALGDHVCDLDGLRRLANERDAKDDGYADARFISLARSAIPALVAALRAVLDECARMEQATRKVWDDMEDYADIGHPKGPCPDDALVSANRVKAAVAAALEGLEL